jgi:excisionase family DNA binding protein
MDQSRNNDQALWRQIPRDSGMRRDMTPNIATTEGLINLRDAADFMGCSTVTIRRMAKRGDIPAMRLPGTRLMRFRRSTLQGVIESCEVAVSKGKGELDGESAI